MLDNDTIKKKLSHRQKLRAKKRLEQTKDRQKQISSKINEKKRDIIPKGSEESDIESEAEFDESNSEQEEMTVKPSRGFSDDNKVWLKPKQDKGESSNEELTSDDENVSN